MLVMLHQGIRRRQATTVQAFYTQTEANLSQLLHKRRHQPGVNHGLDLALRASSDVAQRPRGFLLNGCLVMNEQAAEILQRSEVEHTLHVNGYFQDRKKTLLERFQ